MTMSGDTGIALLCEAVQIACAAANVSGAIIRRQKQLHT